MPDLYGFMSAMSQSSRHDDILWGFLIYLENKMEQFIEFVVFFALSYKADISNYISFIFQMPIQTQIFRITSIGDI